jgi:hypothetical protein
MSFFSNNHNPEIGNVTGSPLNGLCEKVCIQVKKVFDASLSQITMEHTPIVVSELTAPPHTPITFISGRSTATKGTISNLTVERLEERPHFARVKCDVTIPLEAVYVDAGEEGRGQSSLTVHKDIILFVPEASIIPYSIEASVSCVLPEGAYESHTEGTITFDCDSCVTVILKVVIEVELLVPSYGYAHIPPSQDFTQEICSGFFEMPLFPNPAPRTKE